MAVTKAELAEMLAAEKKLQKCDAYALVDLLFEEMRQALEQGVEVKISRFGNFDLRDKNPRPGRNPKTGEEVKIAARRVVTFKSGRKLRARVEGNASAADLAGDDDDD